MTPFRRWAATWPCNGSGRWQDESGIGPLTRFPLRDDFPVRIAGQMPDIDQEAYPFLTARHQAAWHSPVFKYGMLSVARALERSGIEISADLAPRVAVTYSSAVGGLDAVLAADRKLQAENRLPHPYANPNSCINMVGGKIAMLTGAKGPILSTITACATGLTSILVGAMLMAQNRADVVICGAVDCALVEPIVAGFATMNGAYHPQERQGERAAGHGQPPFFHRPARLCHFRGGRGDHSRHQGVCRGPWPALHDSNWRAGA